MEAEADEAHEVEAGDHALRGEDHSTGTTGIAPSRKWATTSPLRPQRPQRLAPCSQLMWPTGQKQKGRRRTRCTGNDRMLAPVVVC